MSTTDMPDLTEEGYGRIVDHGRVQTVWYPDGRVRLRHECRRPYIVLHTAPLLQLDNGHTIVSTDPVTVTPSIMCADCGLHGFLTDGVWKDC
ncbi:hypothetical protein [Gordonia soli]|uniref:Uncharacterized protein n=1 Tax=Gordonia soli NBRC 108243 TaxID=1223545 RepID=M0QR14_9ACTN|nr:hypothetical protein [Gordonia soli]GAC71038.1 hypothetical protein GS4_47_00280 [Gordonia soli NBRC 108243]